jgi:single-stranded-DNA-specific exonuclease
MPGKWEKRPPTTSVKENDDGFLSKLMSVRNIPKDADSFFSPSVSDLKPSRDMFKGKSGQAADLIRQTLTRNSPIGVIGDYDVDGILSTTLLIRACKQINKDVDIRCLIPSRQKEGYGLNPKTIASYISLWNDKKPSLTVVVDSGTSSRQQISELKEWSHGKTVIIDHHIPDPKNLSDNADFLLNWRIDEEDEMCAAGEVYHVVRALFKDSKEDTARYMPFAAVATVADMVPINQTNRILVRNGLDQIWLCGCLGLAMVGGKKVSSGDVFQSTVAFEIAPRINAVGRMEDAQEVLEAMLSDDFQAVSKAAKRMELLNSRRKDIQRRIEREAVARAEASGFVNGILLYDLSWTHGICGIAASSVVEKTGLPCILVGEHGGEAKGSGRSPAGVNIKLIMDSVSGMFSRYGGHERACGATIIREALETAPYSFDAACGRFYQKHGRPSITRWYDADLDSSEVTIGSAKELLRTFYPYDEISNPEPVFRIKAKVEEQTVKEPEDKKWKLTILKCSMDDKTLPVRFKSYRDDLPGDMTGKTVSIFFSFQQSVDEDELETAHLVDIAEA